MKTENKPLITAEELVNFTDSNDILIHLSIKEAEILLGYMEGHGYALEECDGKLMRKDLCSDCESPEIQECSIDDAIDAACEWNYELLQEAEAARENPKSLEDFIDEDNQYRSLQEDEKVLDQMFDRTKYGKEIAELAEKLAFEFIQKIEQNQDIKDATHSLAEGITQQRTNKKGMVR